MSTELDNKVRLDCQDVVAKLSFLVGRTILFRDGYDDACTATNVVGVKAENTAGANGYPHISIYTGVGVTTMKVAAHLRDIMVLEEDGSLTSLGEYTDAMGIVF